MDHSTGSQDLLARFQNQAHCLDGGSFQRKLLGKTGHCAETGSHSFLQRVPSPNIWIPGGCTAVIGNFNDTVSVVLSSRSLEQRGNAAHVASLAGFLGSLYFGG